MTQIPKNGTQIIGKRPLNVDKTKHCTIYCRQSISIEIKIADTPLCCALPINDKSNPFINFF